MHLTSEFEHRNGKFLSMDPLTGEICADTLTHTHAHTHPHLKGVGDDN